MGKIKYLFHQISYHLLTFQLEFEFIIILLFFTFKFSHSSFIQISGLINAQLSYIAFFHVFQTAIFCFAIVFYFTL